MVVGAQNLCAIEASTTRVERRPPCCDAKVMMMKGVDKEYPTGAKPPHIGAPIRCPRRVVRMSAVSLRIGNKDLQISGFELH